MVANQYEFERRFLVNDLSVIPSEPGDLIEQTYLWASGGYAIRARLQHAGSGNAEDTVAFLTVKGPRKGVARAEFELPLPVTFAAEVFGLGTNNIIKRRHSVVRHEGPWMIDVFEGANSGLIIAEYEASQTVVETLHMPWWCSREVTQDRRYNNENLAANPWPLWRDADA